MTGLQKRVQQLLVCLWSLLIFFGVSYGQSEEPAVHQLQIADEAPIDQVSNDGEQPVSETLNSMLVLDYRGYIPIGGNTSYSITYIAGSSTLANITRIEQGISQAHSSGERRISTAQHGDGNEIEIFQKGSGNSGMIIQADVDISEAKYAINRVDPCFLIPVALSSCNYARIDQTNTAGFDLPNGGFMLQRGDSNYIDLEQYGWLNEAGILQSGSGQSATLSQDGAENPTDISQQE